MKYIHLNLLAYIFFTITLKGGEIFDTAQFQPQIGSVYQYKGIFSGENGTMTISYHDGSLVMNGALRGDVTFNSASGNSDYSMQTYVTNGSLIQRRINNQYGNFIMHFDPYWRLGPRYIQIGKQYNSSSNFTYSVQGLQINGDISAKGGIIDIENVNTKFGILEALKAEFHVILNENSDYGWSQGVETDTFWIVRDVGIVKFKATGTIQDSFGGHQTINMNYNLDSTNIELPKLSATPSWNWYNDWCFVDYPWIYSSKSNSWFYYGGEPKTYNFQTKSYPQLGSSKLSNWVFLQYPYLYSYTDNNWYYIFGPTPVYDTKWNNWIILK